MVRRFRVFCVLRAEFKKVVSWQQPSANSLEQGFDVQKLQNELKFV